MPALALEHRPLRDRARCEVELRLALLVDQHLVLFLLNRVCILLLDVLAQKRLLAGQAMYFENVLRCKRLPQLLLFFLGDFPAAASRLLDLFYLVIAGLPRSGMREEEARLVLLLQKLKVFLPLREVLWKLGDNDLRLRLPRRFLIATALLQLTAVHCILAKCCKLVIETRWALVRWRTVRCIAGRQLLPHR